MKLFNVNAVLLLFVPLFLLSSAVLATGSKKRGGDITQKSNSNDETDEEITREDIENAFEQLRELRALRDTLLKSVPTSESLMTEKISNHRKDETDNKAEADSKENFDNLGTKNVWMKTMIAQSKNMNFLNLDGGQSDSEDTDTLENYDKLTDEVIQEPLSPEQEKGKLANHRVNCHVYNF